MKALTYASVYNRCYGARQSLFVSIVKRNLCHSRSLRTRYHWSRHVHTMISTRNPSLRFTSHSLPPTFPMHVATCRRLCEIALLQALRKLQRALVKWIWRPHGSYFNRYLSWDKFTSRLDGGVGAGA